MGTNTAHACRGVISNIHPVDDCLIKDGAGHDAVDESTLVRSAFRNVTLRGHTYFPSLGS